MYNSAKAHQTLKQPQPPGIWAGYPKYIPDDSPKSVQQHDTQLDTDLSSIWRRHWALKDRVKPRHKNLANHSLAQGMLFGTTPPP